MVPNQPFQISLPFPGTILPQLGSSTPTVPASEQFQPPQQLLIPQQSPSSVGQHQQVFSTPFDQFRHYPVTPPLTEQVQPFIHQQVVIEENSPLLRKDHNREVTDELREDENNRPFRSPEANKDIFDHKLLHKNAETTDSDQIESDKNKNLGMLEPVDEHNQDVSKDTGNLNVTVSDHSTEASERTTGSPAESLVHELIILSYRNELLKVPLTYEGANDMVLLEEASWSPTLHSIPHDMFPRDKSSGISADVDDELEENSKSVPFVKQDIIEIGNLTYKIDDWKSDEKSSHPRGSSISREGQKDAVFSGEPSSHVGTELQGTDDDKPKENANDEMSTSTKVSYEDPYTNDFHTNLTRKRNMRFPNQVTRGSLKNSSESKESSECLQKIKENAKVIADMLINKARNVMNKLEINK